MTISHRPSVETLMRYAAGTLGEGATLVVATHLAMCAESRGSLRALESVGGLLLDDMPPAAMEPDALARAMARIERSAQLPAAAGPLTLPKGVPPLAPLLAYGASPWRMLGPGIRWSRVGVPLEGGQNVILLKVAAGRRMPAHSHTGEEYTCVLRGSFSDETGRYGPGDLEEADGDLDHQPVAGVEEDCICLIAMEGKLRIHSLLGRLAQPFVGM